MRLLIIAVIALLMSGCVMTGKPRLSCPAGIAVPFVAVGVNTCPTKTLEFERSQGR